MISCSVKTVVWSLVSVFLVTSGIVLLSTHNAIFNYIYNTQLVLSPTSGSFPMWSKLPEPMLASMYLWEVKNPDQVSLGSKPILEERGPYVFTEQHTKVDPVWNDNGTVTYKQRRVWHFVPDLSIGSLEDTVTILNPVAATIGALMKDEAWLRPGVNVFLKSIKENLFVTEKVKNIIFDGYHDPLFDNLEKMLDDLPFIRPFIPPGSLMDKFGFFYGRNGTDYIDGVWNMYTGEGDNAKMGKVHSWNYTNSLYWPSPCGQVEGGAGEFYPPGLEKTYIEMYSNDLCRSLKFNFTKAGVYTKGISSYEFRADEYFFANATMNPANKCFDSADLPSGVFDVSACRFGAPVFISLPHFYLADQFYLDKIESGLTPNESLHSTIFRVEPRSGIPLDVSARFQLNVKIEKIPGLSILDHVTETYFPVMWFENKAGVPDNLVFKMKLMANLHEILEGIGWVQIGLALAIGIISLIIYISRRKSEEDQCPILNQSHHEDSQDEDLLEDKD